MQIVGVKFKNSFGEGFTGRVYTYFVAEELTLKAGDIVTVPTAHGEGTAQVARVDVPESEIEAFRDKVKTITQPPAAPELI